MNVKFEWDSVKAQANQKKHKVTFEEAATVFRSFPLQIFHDPDNSQDEDRFIAVGSSYRGRTLLVVHCENSTGTVIRIISARRATKKETNDIFGEN